MENGIIVVEFEGTEYKFREDQIVQMGLTAVYNVQDVADILAANIEVPELDEDGVVDVSESLNFNDCYEDMMADLRGEDDDNEDDDES